ncbi:MAG TPA: phospholipase C, phosphocholine-specific [Edaphobacter sp.]|nr:phospholipase C, phosphocholine-specific [Edaphobacter sp.]
MQSRRDFLKKAVLLSGAAGFSGAIPESVQRAFAIEPDAGTTYLDAEHIVILMQENRSFDHALGSLQGVRGFNDPRALRQANGNSVFLQTSAAGQTYAPWRLDIKDTRVTWMGSIPHSRESQVDAWNGGHHNDWIDAKRPHNKEYAEVPLTMGHYTREDLPFYYALADAFTVCDQHYCGVMSSTTPNRVTFWTGTVRDKQSTNSKVYMRNEEIAAGVSWPTFPEKLQQAGIPWKFYQNDLEFSGGMTGEQRAWLSNFGCNVLEFFANYNVQLTPRFPEYVQEKLAGTNADIKKLQAQIEAHRADPQAMKKFQKQLSAKLEQMEKLKDKYKKSQQSLSGLPSAMQDLHKRAFVTNDADSDFHELETIHFEDGSSAQQMEVPKGDILHQFRQDVNTGKLPAVSFLASPEKFSDHPTSPWYGAWYVSEVMDILTRNPEVWKKTIFILTYDENDGYFDHAPSFVAADPKRKETGGASAGIDTGLEYTYVGDELVHGVSEKAARSGPIGLGYRVPMIIASPWSRGGWVNSQLFDHTSTTQFLEDFIQRKYNKQVKETNISAWRRAICGNLTSVFRPYDGKRPSLPFVKRDPFVESIQRARYKEIPSNFKALSAEEIGAVNRNPRASKLISAQEPGVRQSCAIPYEAYAEGSWNSAHKSFDLKMTAANSIFRSRAAGLPFNVYLYGTKKSTAITARELSQPNMMAATYAVRAGDTLQESFPLSLFTDEKYAVAVHGPNGFFREFTGNHNDPEIEIACKYQTGSLGPSGNVEVHLTHRGGNKSYKVEVIDNSYGAKTVTKTITPGSKEIAVLDLGKQHGWYDFSVKVDGSNLFEKRYAGRVETGRSSYSDPLMGGELETT